jgi:hypothetical protein
MVTVNSIVQNQYYAVNNNSQSTGTEQIKQAVTGTTSGDQVDISTEAKNALTTSKALARSEEMMRRRGLDDEEIDSFRDILSGYESSGENAGDFLKTLSSDERDLVKRANSYGLDLSNEVIDGFSKEGAINMLREQDYRFAVDLNGDDLIENGSALTFSFPPPSAPEGVMDAWDTYSQDLDGPGIMNFTSMFLPVSIPGYPDATTIRGYNLSRQGFPETEDGWIDLLDKLHDTLDYNKKLANDQQQIEHMENEMRMLREFASLLG